MCKYSIIVIAYNQQKYIDHCLSSIKNQTVKDFEVIVVDDGSTDDTNQICSRVADEDSRFQTIRTENQGAFAARIHGVLHAKGAYYMFVDGDDWLHSKTIEVCNQYLDDAKVEVLQFGRIKAFKHIKSRTHQEAFIIDRKKLIDSYFKELFYTSDSKIRKNIWGKVYSRTLFKDAEQLLASVGRMDIGEDVFMLMHLLKSDKLERFLSIDEPLYYYRQNSGITSRMSIKKYQDYSKLKSAQATLIHEIGYDNDVLYRCHLESVYIIISNIKKRLHTDERTLLTEDLNIAYGYDFVKSAIDFFENHREYLFEELEIFVQKDSNKFIAFLHKEEEHDYIQMIVKHIKQTIRRYI